MPVVVELKSTRKNTRFNRFDIIKKAVLDI